MTYDSMNLSILLPYGALPERTGVTRLVVETIQGAFGIWPNRLDCTAAITPGILTYETEEEGVFYTALDEGVMIKVGQKVLISVRNAIEGHDLNQLREAVESEFLHLDEQERNVRRILAKLESGFIRNFQELMKHA